MVIGLMEYGEVRIYDTVEVALAEWGRFPSDLANWVIVFYDEQGRWLEPLITVGPKRWFGLRSGHATVNLRPNESIDPGAAVEPIGIALRDAESMLPNKYFQSLDQLRDKFPVMDNNAL